MSPNDPEPSGLPLTVIGGYLGAGKTTLVNRWLRQARDQGLRLAILVNDFGEIGIDAELIVADRGDILELAGGCVCCSFGSDLMAALLRLRERQPRPDHVLVETSGVALPGAVARSARLADPIQVTGVIVLADALSVLARAADRYIGDTITRQLEQADRVLLSRIDLADADRLARLGEWIARVAPGAGWPAGDAAIEAPPWSTTRGSARPAPASEACAGAADPEADPEADPQADPETGPGSAPGSAPGSPPDSPSEVPRRLVRETHLATRRWRRSPAGHEAARRFSSVAARFQAPVDPPALAARLREPALGLERVKGMLTDFQGRRWQLQIAGQGVSLTPALRPPGPEGDRVVCIGATGRLDVAAVRALLQAHGGSPLAQSG